ncbi:alpha/beta hydrolase family protein [Lignipirellula cremea]|uniref:Dienelactone hydrolase family protein n=1 Tax=Lignipirellula cremea TaxID=2528010 RepID=A0A518DT16_9BACT|nr:dienelactone hydrolase family protein [Lignipirellula cremea]QDU94964.1 Dienelactone hydrolase family protein [Lignipirellula cremea]
MAIHQGAARPLTLLLAFMLYSGNFVIQAAGEEPGSSEIRLRYHTPPAWSPPEMKRQHDYDLPSLLTGESPVTTADQWREVARPRLLESWRRILGKIEPAAADMQWFGDVTQAKTIRVEQKEGYRRVELTIPLEKDFFQNHLLLLPDGEGPFPAVIAWTSTSPDYQQPEEWWGVWLAQHGYVVLTSWAFIRHYRDDTSYRNGASEKVYERFGRWLPLAKMAHDASRQAEYLRSLPQVDPDRLGFIGFSLSAKSALYVGAFDPEFKAVVSIDPHLAMHGATNYESPWYLDWRRPFEDINTPDYPVKELRGTVWSLLDADPQRPGFEHNHHELLALCAPRAMLVIGCSADKESASHSDDRQSIAYYLRAREVYRLLGADDHLQYLPLTEGHQAVSPAINAAWQAFFQKHLQPGE